MLEGLFSLFSLEQLSVSAWTLILASLFVAWLSWDYFKSQKKVWWVGYINPLYSDGIDILQ